MENILTQVFQSVGAYIPNLIGALLILIIGWIIALVLSAIVRGVLQRTKLDNKLASWISGKEEESQDVEQAVGKVVFWLIMILVLIAFFQALGLTLVVDPLNQLVNQVLQFLPQLFGAGILLLIAWIIASVLRLVVTRILGAAKLDERVGGQAGIEDEKQVPLTKTIGDVVYWLIFLLFLPAVLGALELEGLLKPVQGMLNEFLGFLPNLLAAGLIGVIGWFIFQYSLIIKIEEEFLENKFGEEYLIYKNRVHRFIPNLTSFNNKTIIKPNYAVALRSETRTFQALFSAVLITIIFYLVK